MATGTRIYGGVPIPTQGAGAPRKYPFHKMKPGEHFIWKCDPDDKMNSRASSIATAASNRGYKVKTRVDGNMIRVWMVGRKHDVQN